ncbi:uncharacterized protein LOC130894948 [Diorhabda carinulata]|uniref:uncharacterized protein LOC130448416 n=1 Tax=Diorhabda sublineata TaxID=1163346 RepID=UPI0024E10E47|nr:uncharacterized protein LOC130448416 [Diorhabda sublineata]XP_057657994.1 uncharacterized protein LOC130894948 [Diorhabda carinulata]
MQAILILSVLTVFSLTTVYAMECYNCNTTYMTERKDDACKDIENIGHCTDPSICISVVIEIQEGTIKKYNALKQCQLPQNGQECELFLKNIQNMQPGNKIQYYDNKCQTCDKTGCNKSTATAVTVPAFLAFIAFYVLCKLM